LREFAQANMAGANFTLRNFSGEKIEIID
jgi:hypothetical protein